MKHQTGLRRESFVHVQQKRKLETGTAANYTATFIIVAATALLAVFGGAVLYAQGQDKDKYSLRSPGGIAFSDFRGYEDWSVASSARTDEVLKVIVANPAMIKAYQAGVPGNGQPFSEGSRIVKLQWKPKKSTEAPFEVDVPDVFRQAFVMEKDSRRFPKTGGWGYAVFNYDAASDKFTADPKSPSDCGHACGFSPPAQSSGNLRRPTRVRHSGHDGQVTGQATLVWEVVHVADHAQ